MKAKCSDKYKHMQFFNYWVGRRKTVGDREIITGQDPAYPNTLLDKPHSKVLYIYR